MFSKAASESARKYSHPVSEAIRWSIISSIPHTGVFCINQGATKVSIVVSSSFPTQMV